MVKGRSLPNYLPLAEKRIIGFITFSKGISAKCKRSWLGFEVVSPCPFPTTITNTPQALSTVVILLYVPIKCFHFVDKFIWFFFSFRQC